MKRAVILLSTLQMLGSAVVLLNKMLCWFWQWLLGGFVVVFLDVFVISQFFV